MKKKIENADYGEGSSAAVNFYQDFLLVMNNCLLYNSEDSEVTSEAARIMSLLPETFAGACMSISGESKLKKQRG